MAVEVGCGVTKHNYPSIVTGVVGPRLLAKDYLDESRGS